MYSRCFLTGGCPHGVNWPRPSPSAFPFQAKYGSGRVIGRFDLRRALENYCSQENLQLSLSGVMTFFFGTLYFQYHLSRIRRWQQTGVLS
jgi:hypothetical protein